MTKASYPTRNEPYRMFEHLPTDDGPKKGQGITVNGNMCTIKNARLMSNDGHFFYRIVAEDDEGKHYSTVLPTEVLQFTGWGWQDSPVPFDLCIDRDDFDWHIVDNDTQRELDIRAPNASTAVAKAITSNAGFGETLLVHPVFSYSIKPSGSRWIASIRRLLKTSGPQGGKNHPLSDTFTHPSARTCALGPLGRLSRREVIQFGQDLDELFEKYIPEGIKWPALGAGTVMCSRCFKEVSPQGSQGTRCECHD